jgi:hypothetical protein
MECGLFRPTMLIICPVTLFDWAGDNLVIKPDDATQNLSGDSSRGCTPKIHGRGLRPLPSGSVGQCKVIGQATASLYDLTIVGAGDKGGRKVVTI